MTTKSRSTWGSKRERGKGKWELRWNVGGRPMHETFHGTRKEADARLAELRIKYEGLDSAVTLREFYHASFVPWMEATLAPKTIDGYSRMWRLHIDEEFGDTVITDIQPAEVQRWLLTKTYQTAKHAKVAFSSILTRALALGVIDENVCQRRFQLPDKSTTESRPKEVYTHDELDEIAEECRGEAWELAFILAAFGGGQRSEVAGVRLDEVYGYKGWLVAPVRRSVHYIAGEGAVVRDHAKNRNREESILVAPPHSQRGLQLVEERLAKGEEWVCDDGGGNPMNPMTFSQGFSRWFQRKPYRYIPFMNLRPSYATWMRDEGYSMDDVARLMRHSSTEMLKRVYDRPRARQMIDGLMGNYGQKPILPTSKGLPK